MTLKRITIFIFFMLLTGCNDSEGFREVDTIIDSNRITTRFFDGDTGFVWDRMSDDLREKFGSRSSFNAFQRDIVNRFGSNLDVQRTKFFKHDQFNFYDLLSESDNLSNGKKLGIFLSFTNRDGDKLRNFEFREVLPAVDTNNQNYQARAAFDLPFEAEWLTLWGGDTGFENANSARQSTRFGHNFVRMNNGIYFLGNGLNNDDHYCFTLPIRATASGTVVAVENTVPDNSIGEANTNLDQYYGNYVVVDHGNNEFSITAHMVQNSIVVRMGDTVERGDFIGSCGNSGAVEFPQVHIHLQDSPGTRVSDATIHGLPMQFESHYNNGDRQSQASPVRGDLVEKEIYSFLTYGEIYGEGKTLTLIMLHNPQKIPNCPIYQQSRFKQISKHVLARHGIRFALGFSSNDSASKTTLSSQIPYVAGFPDDTVYGID
ncbi:MAG: M23 family metallopeptidase [Pseudomonadota bacterium]